MRLKWADAGVALNPELKLLQYNLGQPLELSESDGYMPEKHGTLIGIIYIQLKYICLYFVYI